MLVRNRKSRIYFLRQFFDYPIQLSTDTLKKLGLVRTFRIGISYIRSTLHQIKPEKSLETFFINRFGKELYRTFFRSYTEKVWGVPCDRISAEWGVSDNNRRARFYSLTRLGAKQLLAERRNWDRVSGAIVRHLDSKA